LLVLQQVLGVVDCNGILREIRNLSDRGRPLDLSEMYLKDISALPKIIHLALGKTSRRLVVNLKDNRLKSLGALGANEGLIDQGRVRVLIDHNDISARELEYLRKKSGVLSGTWNQDSVLMDTPFRAMCDCSTQRFTSSARPRASDRRCDASVLARVSETARALELPFIPSLELADEPPRTTFPLRARERESTLNALFGFFFNGQPEANCQSVNSELIRRRALSLEYPSLTDFSPLAGFEDLRYLNIQGQSPLNWKFLKTLHLSDLDIDGTQVTDLSIIEHMTSLRNLYAEKNLITSVAPIERLIRRQIETYGLDQIPREPWLRVCLNDNQIKDLDLLKPYTQRGLIKVVVDTSCEKHKSPFGI
ncbi:MAG: hypothetical protein K2X47_18585, partial [Bdellovibrionales bacterium]|nr:hypothetical protein [Bdellovibrionales bacterium]